MILLFVITNYNQIPRFLRARTFTPIIIILVVVLTRQLAINLLKPSPDLKPTGHNTRKGYKSLI